MFDLIWRLVKRFAVLLPGLVIAYFSVRDVFPVFDKRVPDVVAVLLTYIVGAYVLIPALIRLFRIVKPPKHLPLYCVTPDGFASDPVNIGIIGSKQELVTVMEQSGWYVADSHTIRHLPRHILSILFGWSYPNAPVSSLYLFGRKQDIAFEIPIDGAAGSRHHVRFWATTYKNKRRLDVKSIHWHHRRALLEKENLLWVGAASLDIGIAPIRHNLQLTHMVHPDTNAERELIISQLKAEGVVARVNKIRLSNAYKLTNRAWRASLHADGKMSIITLVKKR